MSGAIKLGPSGACVLAEWLRENEHARTLGLQGTAIADDGLRMLAEVIAQHPCITNVDLRNSGVGERGLRSLAEALRPVGEPRLAYIQHEAWGGRAVFPGQASVRLPTFNPQTGAPFSRHPTVASSWRFRPDGFISPVVTAPAVGTSICSRPHLARSVPRRRSSDGGGAPSPLPAAPLSPLSLQLFLPARPRALACLHGCPCLAAADWALLVQLLRANRELEVFAVGSVALHGSIAARAAREARLDLVDARIQPEQLHLVTSILTANERLRSLDLANNDFSTMTGDARPLSISGWGGTTALPRSGDPPQLLEPTLPRLLRECRSLVHLDLQARPSTRRTGTAAGWGRARTRAASLVSR